MPETTPAPGTTAGYAQRISDDLSTNESEQNRLRAELARVQDELSQLESSHQVLVKMQSVLGETARAEKARGKSKAEAAPVPAARRGKDAAAQRTAKTPVSAAGKADGKQTWGALIAEYLAGHNEPKSAAEITTALAEAHPQRKVQATVVRSTLEQGVARGLLERSKQGRSVYYGSTNPKASSEEAAVSA